MLKLNDVTFSYGEKKVLEHFDLTVRDGECVCLTGPSGCGKTTAMRLLLGLERPQSGSVTGGNIAVVFQEDRLLPWRNVKRNLLFAVGKEKYEYARELLTTVGLGEDENSRVEDLSGGMKRRLSIVRAVAFGGDALILDEPFNGIDRDNKRILAEIIKRDYCDRGKPVLMVSHNPEDAALLGAVTVHMEPV